MLCYAGDMARDKSAREDLLREATALVERIELRAHDITRRTTSTGSASAPFAGGHIVAGFRASGGLSIFFGEDPVYQFNAAGELRRAYCNGMLYKAARGRLVSLRRERHHDAVQLVSRELTAHEQHEFVLRMQHDLQDLARELNHGGYTIVGQVPPEADVLSRVRAWLSAHDGLPIAASPRV
jgi:hypothetical protein